MSDRRTVFTPDDPLAVLHVDDDDGFAETLVAYLEDVIGGFSVTHVPDGDAALDRLSTTTFDCVVSDYQMPGMDGLELSEAVHERHPRLPFVLLTAKGSESVAREAVEASVTSYLPKRADRDGFQRLADRVRDAVARAHTAVSYREVFDKAGVGLTVRGTETGRLLAVNDAYCETLGYDRGTLLSATDPVLASGDGTNDRPTVSPVAGAADRAAAFRTAVADGTGTATWATEDADGDRVWLDVRYEIATIGGRDRVLGSVHDVTDRRKRRERLTEQTEQVAALHDAATRIRRCETVASVYEALVRAAEEILEFDISGVDAREGDTLVPRAVSAAISEDEYYETTPVDAEDNLAATAVREGEPSVVDDLRARDATPADTEFRSALTVPVGEYGVFQAVSRSVAAFDESDLELTELLVTHARDALARLERERELRREKERSEVFGSAVSHDMRNPLNVAAGHLSLARERYGDDENLAAVASALDRMETITEDVLTIAREGTTVEETEQVRLAAITRDCWRNVDTGEASLRTADESFVFAADPRRLQHVVENLFRNAVEHAGPAPEIEVGRLTDADGGPGFYVADDGPGIDPDRRGDVFDPGYTTASDGTGFGLAIVREMAEAHGWTVSVTASAAGGARFEFAGVETEPRG